MRLKDNIACFRFHIGVWLKCVGECKTWGWSFYKNYFITNILKYSCVNIPNLNHQVVLKTKVDMKNKKKWIWFPVILEGKSNFSAQKS